MVSKSIIGAACTCLSIVSINASAAIISVDWNNAGDNLITQVTGTGPGSGLEWLDLTATTSRSYDDISAKLGTGQEFDGWRYATQSEVSAFFDAFGGDSAYYIGEWTTQNNGLFDLVSAYWGDAYCETNSCSTGEGFSYFVTAEVDYIYNNFHSTGFFSDWIGISLSLEQDYVGLGGGYIRDDVGDQLFGAALVRESVVPVPAAVYLFGSGLLGLFGVARRKGRV